jgi:antibiotic biosynthesis monooxygenase (ABM) superfamily enzyme
LDLEKLGSDIAHGTVLAVWPVSMLVPWALTPLIGRLSMALQALFIAVGIVILLTWAVMPVLVRILRPWLDRRP